MTAHGNVLASTAFLQGLAAEELEPAELDTKDPLYPLLITVRAVKAGERERRRSALVKLLRRLRSALGRRPRGPAVILMYHRIAVEPLDPWRLCVTPASFAGQLDWLRAHCRVIPLRQLAGELRRRRPRSPERRDQLRRRLRRQPARRRAAAARARIARHLLPDHGDARGATRVLVGRARTPVDAAGSPARDRSGSGSMARKGPLPRAAPPRPAIRSSECRGVQPWKAAAGTRLAFYYQVWDSLRPLEEPARQQALEQLRAALDMPEATGHARRTLTHRRGRAARRLADRGHWRALRHARGVFTAHARTAALGDAALQAGARIVARPRDSGVRLSVRRLRPGISRARPRGGLRVRVHHAGGAGFVRQLPRTCCRASRWRNATRGHSARK